MVQRGQFLERMVVVRSGDLSLEALYHRGERAPPAVLCAPHPKLGGSMDAPVVAELAWAVTRAGHATLRFNYRGVGASQGRSKWLGDSPPLEAGFGAAPNYSDEEADTEAAFTHLLETTAQARGALVGYSFGARVALGLALRDPRVERLALVAPPTKLMDFTPLATLRIPALVVAAHLDDWCDRPWLSSIEGLRFEVVAHANHFFDRNMPDVGKHVAAFLDPG
jgi:hypothetical protein